MKTFQLDDKQYKLAEIMEIAPEILKWAKPLLPDPLDQIKDRLKGFPTRERDVMIRQAMTTLRTPLSIDAPEVIGLLHTPEGIDQLLSLTFKKHQPDMTLADCWQVHLELVKTYGERYMEDASSRN